MNSASLPLSLSREFPDWEIVVQRSSRRRTIGLMVTADGRVVVRAPQGARQTALLQALRQHQDWLARKVAERREAWNRLEPGSAYFRGQPRAVTVARGEREQVAWIEGRLLIRLPPTGGDPWEVLQSWYDRQARELLDARVADFARRMRLTVGRLELRNWQGRWGECRPREGELRFHWRLVLLPPEILDYVVVHELAHLREPGHTPGFWNLVAQVLPDYLSRRGWLNRYGTSFLLWQWTGLTNSSPTPGETDSLIPIFSTK